MQLTVTLIIVIITCLVSIGGFSNQKIIDDLTFHPPSIVRNNQYYRFITHGLIHADFIHLAFNMIALYSFGTQLEMVFSHHCFFGGMGKLVYALLYVGGLIVASLPDFFKYRDNYNFRSLGASGAVCAVIFASVLILPKLGIGFAFIPTLSIPGYIFAVLYLGYCIYADKKDQTRINHSAHLWGSLFGLLFIIVAVTAFAQIDVWENLQEQFRADSPFLPSCEL